MYNRIPRLHPGIFLAATIAVALALLPPGAGQANGDERERTLIIGKVSTNPKKHYNYLEPIASYAAARMGDLGIDKIKIVLAKDNRQMISYLKRNKVDWVTETIFSAVEFQQKADAEMFLLKHKKGVASYNTVFFARKDSGIESLQDLKGKVIAFEDQGSTSGFFIPASIMLDAGLEMIELDSPREKVDDDSVGYVFAKDEINMSTWVHKGLVDAGAYSNLDWIKDDHNPVSFRESMQVFHESVPYPRAIELVRKNLRPVIKQRLKSILLAAHEDPEAKAAMRAYQKTTRFEELDADMTNNINGANGVMDFVKDKLAL